MVLLISCSTEFDQFEEAAEAYSDSDGQISQEERADLINRIQLNSQRREFARFFTDGSIDDTKLARYLEKKGFKIKALEDSHPAKDTYVNVYIENSGSMNGYISGNTEFKAAIQDLLVLLKYEYGEEKIKVFFINSQIHPTHIATDLANFASALNTKSFKVGDTGSSNLNSVFKQVLDKTSKDTMSILVSDCIYSIKGDKTQELLSNQKSLTKDAFLSKSKSEKLATTIVKLSSKFNGFYWDMNNKKTMLSNKQRPYYIAIIASEPAMQHFNKRIELNESKVDGFKEKLMLTSSGNHVPFYTILKSKFDAGNYKITRGDRESSGGVHSIEEVEADNRNKEPFTFSVAVDMTVIPVSKSEIETPGNYFIEGFTVKGVHDIKQIKDELTQPSLNIIKKMSKPPTHLIVLEASSPNFQETNLIFKKQMPRWVQNTSTIDDTDILENEGKTFGFLYLMEGIDEAYQIASNNPNHFNLKLTLKK